MMSSLLALLFIISCTFCFKFLQAAPPPPPLIIFPSPASTWLSLSAPFSHATLPFSPHTRLSLFNQSSLSLRPLPSPLSFTFTASYFDAQDAPSPTLAFFLLPSPPPPLPVSSTVIFACISEPCLSQSLLLCSSALPQPPFQPPPSCSRLNPDPYEAADEYLFKNEVSLSYDANAAALRVQAIDHSPRSKINQTFTLSMDDLTVGNGTTTLFVGYITRGEATINVTIAEPTMNISAPSSPDIVASSEPTMNCPPSPTSLTTHDDDSKSNHMKVVVGVIVAVSMMGFLMELLIIFIAKRRKRPSLATSRSTGGHGAPPATSRPPFSHHDLGCSPLSPPYRDAFQISGTASWLKQPNPR